MCISVSNSFRWSLHTGKVSLSLGVCAVLGGLYFSRVLIRCLPQLINAAWGGDKHLVRFLLQHGADRSKVGTGHYTEALAPSDFAGLTAEGWARKKGHEAIADLIRVGL